MDSASTSGIGRDDYNNDDMVWKAQRLETLFQNSLESSMVQKREEALLRKRLAELVKKHTDRGKAIATATIAFSADASKIMESMKLVDKRNSLQHQAALLDFQLKQNQLELKSIKQRHREQLMKESDQMHELWAQFEVDKRKSEEEVERLVVADVDLLKKETDEIIHQCEEMGRKLGAIEAEHDARKECIKTLRLTQIDRKKIELEAKLADEKEKYMDERSFLENLFEEEKRKAREPEKLLNEKIEQMKKDLKKANRKASYARKRLEREAEKKQKRKEEDMELDRIYGELFPETSDKDHEAAEPAAKRGRSSLPLAKDRSEMTVDQQMAEVAQALSPPTDPRMKSRYYQEMSMAGGDADSTVHTRERHVVIDMTDEE